MLSTRLADDVTHPGSSTTPSLRDEETFARSFGSVDWAVMFIIAQEGQTYARLRFNIGPGGSLEIPVAVDFGRDFPASNQVAWKAEYDQCVLPPQPQPPASMSGVRTRLRSTMSCSMKSWPTSLVGLTTSGSLLHGKRSSVRQSHSRR